ncbi:MAG TPA: PLP-dependent aminotransferase family protein [Burkholderiaceae bacterium]|nr:PLP-dependent aminotransferase family protein [Burkholderiaceae bacterium]
MDPLFEIRVDMAARGSGEASHSLYRQLREAIIDGRLAPGVRLPATRKAGHFFGVSRNTAADVYDRLLSEGYVATRRGSGTYVADKTPTISPRRSRDHDASSDYRLNDFWLRSEVTSAMGFWRDRSEVPPKSPALPRIDFRPALVDSRLFPFDEFRRVSARQLRKLEKEPASYKSPQGNQGNFSLRAAITKHIAQTRAVVCDADDILVTSGAQQAFDLLARVLITPGQTVVAVEDPGYPPMRVAFAAAGARLAPVGVDAEGLIVEELAPDARVICLCPSHQFPLGVTMSMQRRKALLDFARSHGAVIIEDDYDGEFRYEGSPLAALRTPEAADVVFYIGTFSKCLLPALRLGFLAAPAWAMRALVSAKNCLDWHCSTPIQMGVAGFISEGLLTNHVRKMRETYRQRRRLLVSCLQRDFGNWLDPIPSSYGMHVAAVARTGLDLDQVAQALAADNVKVHTLSRYFLGPPTRTGLVLGYGAVDLTGIRQGLSLLRAALTG